MKDGVFRWFTKDEGVNVLSFLKNTPDVLTFPNHFERNFNSLGIHDVVNVMLVEREFCFTSRQGPVTESSWALAHGGISLPTWYRLRA